MAKPDRGNNYSAELKLEIAQRYLKGDIGIKKPVQEYFVAYGDIQKWRDVYRSMVRQTVPKWENRPTQGIVEEKI